MNAITNNEHAAVESTELAAPPAEAAPYTEREMSTAVKLLALQIESMLRDFREETGSRVDTVNVDYKGKVRVFTYSKTHGCTIS
jgi:hypothetical protein